MDTFRSNSNIPPTLIKHDTTMDVDDNFPLISGTKTNTDEARGDLSTVVEAAAGVEDINGNDATDDVKHGVNDGARTNEWELTKEKSLVGRRRSSIGGIGLIASDFCSVVGESGERNEENAIPATRTTSSCCIIVIIVAAPRRSCSRNETLMKVAFIDGSH